MAAPATDEAAAFAREAQHGAPRRPPALPETLAWAVATAWSEQLPPLRLACDATDSDPLALVQSYEWVHWQLAGVHAAASARATVVAWFWLTSCDGYSGEENPRFWKRVLSELQRNGGGDDDDGARLAAMSDAVRFFDRPGREFPRVHVETHGWSIVQAFTGRQPTSMDAVHRSQLTRMFQRLQPYMASERLQRTIPVSVQSQDLEVVLKREGENGWRGSVTGPSGLLRLRETSESGSEGAFLEALKAELAAAPQSHPSMALPVFEVHSTYVPTWPLRITPQPQDGSLRSVGLRGGRVTCNEGWGDSHFLESGSDAASQLRWLFGANAPAQPSRLLSLSVHRPTLSSSLLAALCSAMPHSTAVSGVQLSLQELSRDPSFQAFTALDWAWLGYSIFHPDADESMCRDLELVVTAGDFSPDSMYVLDLMSKGNNLAHVENATDLPTSECYYLARLALQTEIRRYPSLTAPVILRHAVPTERFSVDTETTQDEWVRVVVPGFGFGWVPSAAVVDVASCPPAQSRLQGLRLRSAHAEADVPRAIDFAIIVGERMTRLDAVACGELTPDGVLGLLYACPKLKTLRVSHNGSLWASPAIIPRQGVLPLLEELSLTVHGPSLRLPSQRLACLRRLRALRVNAVREGDNFPLHRSTVLAFLQAHPSLEYFHWRDVNSAGSRATANRNVYHARRQRSHLLVGELPHPGSSAGLCLSCRYAVVGAVHATRAATPASALGRLDEDLLSLVFSFSPRCGLRDLWIGP